MPTLYVTEPGARIEKEYQRIIVSKGDEMLMRARLSQVTEVVLVGSVGATTPAMLALLDAGVGFTLITSTGKMRGRLRPAEAHNLPLRHQQYLRGDDERFCLDLSRRIVQGKIRNSRAMLRRWLRQSRNQHNYPLQGGGLQAIEKINSAFQNTKTAGSLAELRGLEGSASRAYFGVLRQLLHEDFSFDKRTRRPPRDPANALLSFSYSLLTQAVLTACEVAGFDGYKGFFHADKYGRPALALDLVEEFRSVLADSVALELVNNRRLMLKDFEWKKGGGQGGYLNRRGLKVFLTQFSRRLGSKVYHPAAGRALTYQKVFEVQARQLRKVVEGVEEEYKPFRVK